MKVLIKERRVSEYHDEGRRCKAVVVGVLAEVEAPMIWPDGSEDKIGRYVVTILFCRDVIAENGSDVLRDEILPFSWEDGPRTDASAIRTFIRMFDDAVTLLPRDGASTMAEETLPF